MIRVIPNDAKIAQASIRVPFRTTCRFIDQDFVGTAIITFQPYTDYVEYNSVEAFAESFRGKSMTHEEVARAFYDAVHAALDCSVRVDVFVKSAAHPDAWVVVGDTSLLSPYVREAH